MAILSAMCALVAAFGVIAWNVSATERKRRQRNEKELELDHTKHREEGLPSIVHQSRSRDLILSERVQSPSLGRIDTQDLDTMVGSGGNQDFEELIIVDGPPLSPTVGEGLPPLLEDFADTAQPSNGPSSPPFTCDLSPDFELTSPCLPPPTRGVHGRSWSFGNRPRTFSEYTPSAANASGGGFFSEDRRSQPRRTSSSSMDYTHDRNMLKSISSKDYSSLGLLRTLSASTATASTAPDSPDFHQRDHVMEGLTGNDAPDDRNNCPWPSWTSPINVAVETE